MNLSYWIKTIVGLGAGTGLILIGGGHKNAFSIIGAVIFVATGLMASVLGFPKIKGLDKE